MNNPLSVDPRYALYPAPSGCAGWWLRKMSGLSRTDYLRTFDRRNLLPGQQWDKAEARRVGHYVLQTLAGRTVVLLGKEVPRAMGLDDEVGPLFWQHEQALDLNLPVHWLMMPHPSGRNRHWTQPGAREEAGAIMRELALRKDLVPG